MKDRINDISKELKNALELTEVDFISNISRLRLIEKHIASRLSKARTMLDHMSNNYMKNVPAMISILGEVQRLIEKIESVGLDSDVEHENIDQFSEEFLNEMLQ